jgi:antitoxin (DNA-binding transcriptional repressor) of toxin-antitoxin stability system
MLDLRRNSGAVVADLRRGQALTLMYRGKPLARLLPVPAADAENGGGDPFYRLATNAAAGADDNDAISNAQIDRTLYG